MHTCSGCHHRRCRPHCCCCRDQPRWSTSCIACGGGTSAFASGASTELHAALCALPADSRSSPRSFFFSISSSSSRSRSTCCASSQGVQPLCSCIGCITETPVLVWLASLRVAQAASQQAREKKSLVTAEHGQGTRCVYGLQPGAAVLACIYGIAKQNGWHEECFLRENTVYERKHLRTTP